MKWRMKQSLYYQNSTSVPFLCLQIKEFNSIFAFETNDIFISVDINSSQFTQPYPALVTTLISFHTVVFKEPVADLEQLVFDCLVKKKETKNVKTFSDDGCLFV